MDKVEIADLIEEKHQELFSWLEKQPIENWTKGPNDKWTTGQHVRHLVNSLQLLNNVLSYPRFFLKYKFGTSNRASRDYKTIANYYDEKLLESSEITEKINRKVKKPTVEQRERLLTRLQIQQKKLQYKTKKISEKNLDTLVVPHPVMGKLTIREVIMCTAHHTEHHFKILEKNY